MNIVITGTSTGIGRALAENLLSQGHSILGLARSEQTELTSRFRNSFRSALCDVARWADVEASAKIAQGIWPHVDALVTCAGVQGAIGPAVTADPEEWSATVRTNLDGTYYAFRAFYAQLSKAPRRAKVVAFSGGGATKPRTNFTAYSAAKTGVVRLIETLAEEMAGTPVDINSVAPGAINTRLTDEVIGLGPEIAGRAEYEAAVKQKASGGASLDKAIALVEWLLSPESDGISGRLLSAPWDPWRTLGGHAPALTSSDIYTLRRITPEDRGQTFS